MAQLTGSGSLNVPGVGVVQGGTLDSNNRSTVVFNAPTSSVQVTPSYSGDSNDAPSTGNPVALTVDQQLPTSCSVVAMTPNPALPGQQVTAIIQVTQP